MAFTVKELIDELVKLPASLPVRLADEHGDYRVPVSAVHPKATSDSYEAACLVAASNR